MMGRWECFFVRDSLVELNAARGSKSTYVVVLRDLLAEATIGRD